MPKSAGQKKSARLRTQKKARSFLSDIDIQRSNDLKSSDLKSWLDGGTLPITLNKVQRACLYLHEWQQENCSRLGLDPNAPRCRWGCQLPSIGQVEQYAGIKHNVAQRARKLIAGSPQGKCREINSQKGEGLRGQPADTQS